MNCVQPKSSAVDQSIEAATRGLFALQQPDGHWVFELEADATIPAEYILLRHYLAEPVDNVLEDKIAAYLRRWQGNPRRVALDELFLELPQTIGLAPKAPQQKAAWFWVFRAVDTVLRFAAPRFPRPLRQRAMQCAVSWVTERLNGEHGLGAIFPAMANSVMMFDALGYADGHPHRAIARRSIEKLLALRDHEAYCQPCVSPVWDTALACHSLLEVGSDQAVTQVRKGLEWLAAKQILELKGDWIALRPDVRPGGWAFQYANPHYPDVDD